MRICVATDLSPAGQVAVEQAARLAAAAGAEVQLLHIVHDPELAPAFGDDVPGNVSRAREELRRIADQTTVDCAVDVRTGEDIAATILAAAAGADYLFVSSQGKSMLQRLRLGSVATEVLRTSKIPVVCCPPPARLTS